MKDLATISDVQLLTDKAIVSAIGEGMKHQVRRRGMIIKYPRVHYCIII